MKTLKFIAIGALTITALTACPHNSSSSSVSFAGHYVNANQYNLYHAAAVDQPDTKCSVFQPSANFKGLTHAHLGEYLEITDDGTIFESLWLDGNGKIEHRRLGRANGGGVVTMDSSFDSAMGYKSGYLQGSGDGLQLSLTYPNRSGIMMTDNDHDFRKLTAAEDKDYLDAAKACANNDWKKFTDDIYE